MDNQVFDRIFGTKGHTQLIQRSSEFLRFIISEDSLSIDELEIIWSATRKGDTETKLATYRVLYDVAIHLQTPHLDYLIKKISEIPSEEAIPEEIELIYEMNRLSSRASGFTQKALDFYWNILIHSSEQYSIEIVDLTLTKFCDVLKGAELRDERLETLYKCLGNVEKVPLCFFSLTNIYHHRESQFFPH